MNLEIGELEPLGLLPGASNYTFLARLGDSYVVYKPRRGEAPLWDFPEGTLCRREVAAYVVAARLGWPQVPFTTLRDGPYGIGAVQVFIEHDPAVTAFDLADSHSRELKQIALFDLVINNADRKAGHVLVDPKGEIWSVDHGICFHTEPKLRTVLWEYIGDPIPPDSGRDLETVLGEFESMESALVGLLSAPEIEAFRRRIEDLLALARFPEPRPGRPYPWPPI